MNIVEFFGKEWNVIWGAPVTFVAASVLIAGLVYGVARWAFQSRLDSLKERIALKEDQIGDLRAKLVEVRQAIDTPPAVMPGEVGYSAVLRQLTQIYVFDNDAISADLLAGRELPPEEWLNAQLRERGESWRVRNIHGPIAEIYDVE
jgi:hypothetical protein